MDISLITLIVSIIVNIVFAFKANGYKGCLKAVITSVEEFSKTEASKGLKQVIANKAKDLYVDSKLFKLVKKYTK